MANRNNRRNRTKAAHKPINIQQVHEIAGNPLVGQPGVISRVVTEADITRDYVASSFMGFLPVLQALPYAFDDLTCEFGVEVYERMAQDAEVSSALDVMVFASTASDAKVYPSLEPDHADYEMAANVAEFFTGMIDELETPLTAVRKQMVSQALTFGSSVAELDFDIAPLPAAGDDAVAMVVRNIRPTAPKETAFVVDGFDRLVGVIPTKMPGLTLPVGSMIPLSTNGAQLMKNIVPRAKFLVMTWNPKSNDPRGRSALRGAYTAWWAKQQIINEMLSWFAKFAQPSLWATTAPDAIASCYTDSAGNEIRKEPTEVLLEALTRFRNASVMALPHGSTVNAINMSDGGANFLAAIDWANREITRSILKQHLATSEGQHMARAAADVHQDVLSLIIISLKQWQADAIRRDILRPLTVANFGEQYKHLTPKLDLGDGDGFPVSVAEVAQLMAVEYFTEEQLPFLDKQLGLPVRKADDQRISRTLTAVM